MIEQNDKSNSLTLAIDQWAKRFDPVGLSPQRDAQDAFVDVRISNIADAMFAQICERLAELPTKDKTSAKLHIGAASFDLERCEITPNAPYDGRHYVDVRSFISKSTYSGILKALAAKE